MHYTIYWVDLLNIISIAEKELRCNTRKTPYGEQLQKQCKFIKDNIDLSNAWYFDIVDTDLAPDEED